MKNRFQNPIQFSYEKIMPKIWKFREIRQKLHFLFWWLIQIFSFLIFHEIFKFSFVGFFFLLKLCQQKNEVFFIKKTWHYRIILRLIANYYFCWLEKNPWLPSDMICVNELYSNFFPIFVFSIENKEKIWVTFYCRYNPAINPSKSSISFSSLRQASMNSSEVTFMSLFVSILRKT